MPQSTIGWFSVSLDSNPFPALFIILLEIILNFSGFEQRSPDQSQVSIFTFSKSTKELHTSIPLPTGFVKLIFLMAML